MPTARVIDLSHHQAPRALDFAKRAGIRAAIIKASQGVGGRDLAYGAHLQYAVAAGMQTGAYHFGTGARLGVAQADFFLSCIARAVTPSMIVLDLERNPDGPTMTVQQAEDFVGRIQYGRAQTTALPIPIVLYGGAWLRELKVPAHSPLLDCPLWLADYAPPPTAVPPWPNWTLWQFTDHAGAAPGPDALDGYDLSDAINGDATLDQLFGVAA